MLTVSLWDSCLSIENSDNEAINILTVSLWVSFWDLSFGPDENVDDDEEEEKKRRREEEDFFNEQ